jgi:tetratricopeptide (TPR) repeat protein
MMRWLRNGATLWVAAAVGAAGIAASALPVRDAWQAARTREMYLDEVERAARQSPYDGRTQVLLGVRRVQAGEFRAAARALKQAASAGEDNTPVRLTWAASLAAAGQPEEARAVLRSGKGADALGAAAARLAALPPDAPGGQMAEAVAPENVGPLLRQYAPPNFFSRFVRGGVETETALYQGSDRGKDATVRWCAALLRSRRYAEARFLIEPFRNAHPDDDTVCLTYGDALRGLGLPRKAGLEYIPVVQRSKQSLRALLGVGEMALDAAIIPVAVDAFQRAATLAPDSADAWVGLGKAYLKQGISNAKAIEAFEKGAKLAPERTDFFVSYSHALRMVFRWKEAEALLRRRLADDPEDARALHFLAVTLLDGGRNPQTEAEAEQLFKKSLELEPDAVTAMAKLGLLYVARDRATEAIPLLEAVAARNRYDLSVTQGLARAYQKAGRTAEAREARESAAQLADYLNRRAYLNDRLQVEPMNVALHRKLAALLTEGGEDETARRHQKMADDLTRNPEKTKRDLYMLRRSASEGMQMPGANPAPAGGARQP